MIKLLIPTEKKKGKTTARGFWYSKESKKIYYDYLRLIRLGCNVLSNSQLEVIQKKLKQEAIAYIVNDSILKIFYSKVKTEILPHRIYKEVLRQDLKTAIKEALKRFSGCTVYLEKGKYYIEVFTTI